MKHSICIGTYKAPDFVELNVAQCAKLMPDAPILISDDLSGDSGAIKDIADRYGCAYTVSDGRRGRCGGQLQAWVNGLVFGRQEEADVMMLVTQRFVPVSRDFKDTVMEPFRHNRTGMVTFERPCEFMAVLSGALEPELLIKEYRQCLRFGRYHPEAAMGNFAEKLRGELIRKRFIELVVDEMYLRRRDSSREDYARVASEHGIVGEFDCGSWAMREKQVFIGRVDDV